MTVPYERRGRVGQKARTREALIVAARELLARGEVPTLESTAVAASVSRTTAYRYFSGAQALLVAAYPHAEETSLLGSDPPADPAARLQLVVASHTRRILDHEREMRAVLRLSLEDGAAGDHGLPMHRGLRIGWIDDALAPLAGRMTEADRRGLVYGIGATLGIESFVWLTDVAGLSAEDAVATMGSNASRLLSAALAEPVASERG